MRCFQVTVLAACFAVTGFGQSTPNTPPRFEDYPAAAYAGKIAPVSIVTPEQRAYRAMIANKSGPNFAGEMIVIQWGCGAACSRGAMVSAPTGDIYKLPLAADNDFSLPLLKIGSAVSRNPELDFHQNSRLLILSATPNWHEENHRSWKHYFVWENNRWRLIYRELLLG